MGPEGDSREADGPAGLPPELLAAISHPGGGRVVLITGAGCSVEAPTSLKLAGDLSTDCHRKLVADGVIEDGACDRPDDLSRVADVVFEVTGSQAPLVERFPPEHLRHAEPNVGHVVAAALLREAAVSSVMTLNFDLAQSSALALSGAIEVATVRGPEDYQKLSALNLIYLHRNIDSDPEELILRTVPLENDWRDRWEEVVAGRVIASPVVVFAGLGSPAAVLVETVRRIISSLEQAGATSRVYVVDPGRPEDSRFFDTLGLGADVYVQLPWSDFMSQLGGRVLEEQLADLRDNCERLATDHGWDEEDVSGLCNQLRHRGLVWFGQLRARWFLEEGAYLPSHSVSPLLVADLLLGVAMIQRLAGVQAHLQDEGIVEFEAANGRRVSVICCSGGGHMRWALVEGRVLARRRAIGARLSAPRRALVAGVSGGRTEVSTPPDIVAGTEDNSVVTGAFEFEIVTIDEIRADPTRAQELAAI
jgi:hypothetical protein